MVSAIEPIAVVMKPEARNGFSTNSSLSQPTRPADDEGREQRHVDRHAEAHIGDKAGIGADRHQRRQREVGEPQHGEDQRQTDGRHRKHGAGHQAIQDKLRHVHQLFGPNNPNSEGFRDALIRSSKTPACRREPAAAEATGRDVADLVEVAGTGCALVVDVLAGREQLQPFDRANRPSVRRPG